MTGAILGSLFIFFARIVEISMDTLRLIFIVKEKRLLAVCIGFVQALIWLCVIKIIFSQLDNVVNMIAYAGGFSIGNYVGSKLEEMIALGDLSVQVVLNRCDDKITNAIRESGFGVSSIECKGKQGLKTLLIIQVHRKHFKRLNRTIKEIDPKAFITVLETRKTMNGFFKSCKR